MIDPKLLRKQPDRVADKLARRQFTLDVKNLQKQEEHRKILQSKTQNLQSQLNDRSKAIGLAKSRGQDIQPLCLEVKQLSQRLNTAKHELSLLQCSIRDYALSVPNIPDDQVPYGYDNKDNFEVLRWGEIRNYKFPIRDHVQLGKMSGDLDFAAAVKLTGSRFVVMSGHIVCMYRALTQFMLDLHTEKHGYKEYYLPYLVNYTSLYGTGQLPKFSADLFHTTPTSDVVKTNVYALIPTAEVPLINLMRDKIVNEDVLPLKMMAHTPCFRSEVGSYGVDNKGLIRMHQFDKVEIVQMVQPEQSMQALEEMTNHAETVLQLLKLPYRKVLLCTGDMSFTSCKTYDLEVWLPAENNYREISSCSNIWDFQARRIQARYRSTIDKKTHLLHTLNGSGLAVGRTLVAVLENYQLADGRIEVPEVLQPYMKGLTYIG